MKKPTVEQLENPLNVFFGDEERRGVNELARTADAPLLRNEPDVVADGKASAFVKALKMAFVFLPGAFFLYFSTIFFLYAFFVTKISMSGFGYGSALWASSALMVVFGIGSIENLKSLLLPASTCATAFILFMASSLLPETAQTKLLFEYAVYLFPAALIAPILVKSLIDKTID